MANDDIGDIKANISLMNNKLDNVEAQLKTSSNAINKLADAFADLRVIQERVANVENSISILFHKLDASNSIINRFIMRITLSLIGSALIMGGLIIVDIIAHIKI